MLSVFGKCNSRLLYLGCFTLLKIVVCSDSMKTCAFDFTFSYNNWVYYTITLYKYTIMQGNDKTQPGFSGDQPNYFGTSPGLKQVGITPETHAVEVLSDVFNCKQVGSFLRIEPRAAAYHWAHLHPTHSTTLYSCCALQLSYSYNILHLKIIILKLCYISVNQRKSMPESGESNGSGKTKPTRSISGSFKSSASSVFSNNSKRKSVSHLKSTDSSSSVHSLAASSSSSNASSNTSHSSAINSTATTPSQSSIVDKSPIANNPSALHITNGE